MASKEQERVVKTVMSEPLSRCMKWYMKEHHIVSDSDMVRFALRKLFIEWFEQQWVAS